VFEVVVKVHGIKTCDTCRKARKWLDEKGIDYQWHDLREDGLGGAMVRRWLAALGPEILINRRSTTWRAMDDSQRVAAMDADGAIELLLEHPTLIKRPLFEWDDRILPGFNETVREAL
jgi:arsenate reductase